jgi:ABC-type cobalamin/Fe3+-siderophores transport system ATPase subunit/plasmid maintenance system killer protein
MRQAERVAKNTSTVGIDQLDYLPSNHYKALGYNSNWGNKAGTSSSKVELTFEHEGAVVTANCELRSARNAGISITGSVPNELTDTLRKRDKFFSAYIPGISGIPNKEDKRSQKVVLKACSYGDSNIILRNALLLLQQRNPQNITQIQTWIQEIAGQVKITVAHDESKDLDIACYVEIDNVNRPIELAGTGYLQLIQIFTYILLFAPGILLIDEPDIHLHPTVQGRLVKTLEKVAKDRNVRILLTTHSPFIVREAPHETKVFWLDGGKIESTNRTTVELALGWGAFGKKVIIVSEDSDTDLLKKLISQWPGLERSVTFFPGTGYTSITTPAQAKQISDALGGKFKLLIHRDRDSLTDAEVQLLQTADEQKAAKITVFDLQANPANPGNSFHKLDKPKDKNFWSVRVNADIRLIVHRSQGSLLLCYVDHHDKAYDWAKRRKLETHPATGAAQLVEIRETVSKVRKFSRSNATSGNVVWSFPI